MQAYAEMRSRLIILFSLSVHWKKEADFLCYVNDFFSKSVFFRSYSTDCLQSNPLIMQKESTKFQSISNYTITKISEGSANYDTYYTHRFCNTIAP